MPQTNTAASVEQHTTHAEIHDAVREESCRGVMIYTGYAVSALLLVGALAYHFSTHFLR
jgi:hypothetical protein